jgi:hypothetical protein
MNRVLIKNAKIVNEGTIFEDPLENSIIVSSATVKLFGIEDESMIGKQVSLSIFIPITDEEGYETLEVPPVMSKYTVKGIIQDDTIGYGYIPIQTLDNIKIDSDTFQRKDFY